MNSFQNRQGENLNKKVFQVNEVQRDGTGEIVQIKGNLFRDDSEGWIQEGTPLDAETLTEIVKALAKEVVLSGIDEVGGDIRQKLKTLINTIAINYTNNSITALKEELIQTIEEMATRITEKHVRYSVYETELELQSDNATINPYGEIYIPIKERVTIEFIKSYDSLFRYEYGHVGNSSFAISIQTLNELESYGTSEYNLEFALKSEATGELLTKVYVTVVSIESSTTPED